MNTWQNHIGGKFRPGAGPRISDIRDPATGEAYASASLSTEHDVDDAMRAAAAAFRTWSETTPADRHAALSRIANAMEEQRDDLIAAECRNTGTPEAVMRTADFDQMLDHFRFLAGAARCLEGRAATEYQAGYTSYVRREPVGVCAQIAPWNYPLTTAVWKVVPAIAAGNTVVLKPSELTPITTLMFARIAAAFLPPGVLNVVCGDRMTGRALVAHDTPAMVSFTGSARAGIEVATEAARGMKRLHLELGGKAPALVFGDAAIGPAAASIAEAGYANAGQNCVAATRVLVADEAHDELAEALAKEAAAIKVGPPGDPDVTCGPLISEGQLAKVTGFLDRLPSHSRILEGGRRHGGSGYFLRPAVVTGVRHEDEIAREEVFGPVITVERFRDEDEAVAAANSVKYGLASSVWTRDHDRVQRLTRRLDSGSVWVNAHGLLPAEMPHGGVKYSGYGRDLSVYAFDDYTRIKHVMSGSHPG